MTAAMREIHRLESVPRPSAAERCALGTLYVRVGRIGSADSVLLALVKGLGIALE